MIYKRVGAYVGIDPTAASLHVGHLVPLMALFWLYINGCHTVSLVSRPVSASLQDLIQTIARGGHGKVWRSSRPPERKREAIHLAAKSEYDRYPYAAEILVGKCGKIRREI